VQYTEKIAQSTFIGNLSSIQNQETARYLIHEINQLHPQATHHCPAYILGKKGETFFCSDNQEPPGTAGKPILKMLVKHELSNIILIVTRYFGGVKLGIRGLINAYGTIAEKTIRLGEKIPLVEVVMYDCTLKYDFYHSFLSKVKQLEGLVLKSEYSNFIQVTVQVNEFNQREMLKFFQEMSNCGALEYRLLPNNA